MLAETNFCDYTYCRRSTSTHIFQQYIIEVLCDAYHFFIGWYLEVSILLTSIRGFKNMGVFIVS